MTGIIRLFCLSLCVFSCLYEARGNPIDLDVVLDLDETLIFRDIQREPFFAEVTPGSHQVFSDGQLYRVGSGCGEFIHFLDQLPGMSPVVRSVRLHFASAYDGSNPRKRMEEVLAAIRLPDGRRALELAHRLFYNKDLAPADMSIPEQWASHPFTFGDEMLKRFLAESKKKNLDLWFEDTTNVILVDDNAGWVHPTQFANWIPVNNKSPIGELARVAAVIERAVLQAERERVSVPRALFSVQWEVYRNFARPSEMVEKPSFYERGEWLLRRHQKKFSLSKPLYFHCADAIGRQS